MICLQVDVYLLHFWLHLGQRSFQIEIFIEVAPPIYILVILFFLFDPIKNSRFNIYIINIVKS